VNLGVEWRLVALSEAELEFSAAGLAVAYWGNKPITIGRWQGKLFAFAYKCPHAGGILADGYIDALGNVVCPMHRYKFSMTNGRNVSGEGYYLKRWPVEVREDGVYVGLPVGWHPTGEGPS
jgi:nitrite reductase/ring-hydroxylating ferredoxin subunit